MPSADTPPSVTLTPGDSGRIEVPAGRVTTLRLAEPPGARIESVRITDRPDSGNLTVNPDNSLALVLSGTDHTGPLSFGYEARYSDGSRAAGTARLDAADDGKGWGLGEHYLLEADAAGRMVVEPGESHRKVHLSGSDAALSIEDIARREGISKGKIDGEWLRDHPDYGGSPGMALDPQAGMRLWYTLTDRLAEPSSDWLLIDRGHDYADLGRLVARGTTGESAIHPIVIGAYGTGDRPVVHSVVNAYQDHTSNVVLRDITFTDKVQVLRADHILMENLGIRGETEMNIQRVDQYTLRNADIVDVVRKASATAGEWDPVANRVQGFFVKASDGVLVEGVLADRNGWAEGYDWAMSVKKPQPPSQYSHNFYIQKDNDDVTFRDNVSLRAASFGAQVRSGGLIEGNAFVDGNGGVVVQDGYGESYALFADNVVTSGAYKQVDRGEGALTMGIVAGSESASLVGNIVAHLADPADAQEQYDKWIGHQPLKFNRDPFFNDTMIYNWVGRKNADSFETRNTNVDGLDQGKLDAATIQTFAAELTGRKSAGIEGLAGHLRGRFDSAGGEVAAAEAIVEHFQTAFGIHDAPNGKAETLRFVPDPLGEGVRWDSGRNWDKGESPEDGDRVDLGGNWVLYGGTARIADLDLGGGWLRVNHGRLEVAGGFTTGAGGGTLTVENSGQIWLPGHTGGGHLAVDVTGGRFANTGAVTGPIDIAVSGGEALLALPGGRFELDGGTLAIAGAAPRVGFDGQGGGAAVLRLEDAILRLEAGKEEIAGIREFRSGNWGLKAPDVRSTVEIGDGAALEVDLSAFRENSHLAELVAADTLQGAFDEIAVDGLAAGRAATLTFDYAADTVSLVVGRHWAGTPVVTVEFVGTDGADDLRLGDAGAAAPVVRGFGAGDTADISALLGAAGLGAGDLGGAAQLRQVSAGRTELRLDGDAVAAFEHGAGRSVAFDAGGGRARVESRNTPGEWAGGGEAAGQGEDPSGGPGGAQSPGQGGSQGGGAPAGGPQTSQGGAIADILGGADRVISGSGKLVGNGSSEAIRATGWSEMTGNGGKDLFVFGQAMSNGKVERSKIADYQPGVDEIVLEAGARVDWIRETPTRLVLFLEGERDTIHVYGKNGLLDPSDLKITEVGARPSTAGGVIAGTGKLVGTAADETFHALGWSQMKGYAGADVFVFGQAMSNGKVERNAILDYQPGVDQIVLEKGAEIDWIREASTRLVLFVEGEKDTIDVYGKNGLLDPSDLDVVEMVGAYDL